MNDHLTNQPAKPAAKPPAKWMHFLGSRSHLVREGSFYSLCNIGAAGKWIDSEQYGNRCKICQRLGGAK